MAASLSRLNQALSVTSLLTLSITSLFLRAHSWPLLRLYLTELMAASLFLGAQALSVTSILGAQALSVTSLFLGAPGICLSRSFSISRSSRGVGFPLPSLAWIAWSCHRPLNRVDSTKTLCFPLPYLAWKGVWGGLLAWNGVGGE